MFLTTHKAALSLFFLELNKAEGVHLEMMKYQNEISLSKPNITF